MRGNGHAQRWARRLSQFETLTTEEYDSLDAVAESNRQHFTDDLQKVGDPSDRIFAVTDGVVCQYKLLPDGRRQILGYLFPGDMCDPRQLLLHQADYSMCVLAPADVVILTASTLQKLMRHAGLSRAIERYSLMRQSIVREWQVNVGFRTAFERLSHLVCEIFTSLSVVGLTDDHTFELPFTQSDLADTLALSAVHVNRTLMELRRLGIMSFQNRQVVIHDFQALRSAAGFDPAYLHARVTPALAPA